MNILNTVVQGLLLGGLYALFACGLSLMFGVMRIVNLAHGDLAVVGAYLVWVFADRTGLSPLVGAVMVVPVMMAVGWLLQRLLLERSMRSGELVPLLTTFGLAIVIQNALLETFSPDVRSLGPAAGRVATGSWVLPGGLAVSWLGLLALGVAVAVLGGLQLVLTRTAMGRELRATAQDPDTAALVGIDARAVYARAAAIAVATAGIAGAFLAMRSSVAPSSGPTQLIFAFEAVAIGGFGSLWGTLGGGVVLGVTQTLAGHVDPQYEVLGGHLVFLTVLVARGGLVADGPRFRRRRKPARSGGTPVGQAMAEQVGA